jgi:SecD/SecF fusion protein
MNRSHLWKLLLISFVVVWSIFEFTPPTNRDLLLEFQHQARRPDESFTAILTRAKLLQQQPTNSAYASLKEAVSTNDLSKYFPQYNIKGQKEPNTYILHQIQRAAAGKVHFGLDLQGGSQFLVEMDTNKLVRAEGKDTALENAVEVLRKRVDKLGVAEPLLQPEGANRILIQLPGLSEANKQEARQTIEKAAFLEFRMVHPNSDELLAQGIIEPGYEVLRQELKQADGTKALVAYLVNKKPERNLTGKHVKKALVTRHQVTGEPEIDFELDSDGAKIFEEITKEYSPKGNKYFHLAIVLDGALYSAPRILGPIPGGRGQITGNFDVKEAFTLANVLENPLEAPVKVVDERSVDPSLGKDSIRSGITAAIVGTAAVAAFMAVYYLLAGVVANIALILNIVILLGVMCSIGTTLTLPGIAGVVLTAGMAVDANVLIFERIREELAKGKSLKGALAAGYSRAFGTIFDSHVTTLISSIILIFMGTGPIKGFGVALTIGVAASLFTALVVTRLIFDFLLTKNIVKSLPMMHVIRATKLDFMKLAKPAFALSWLIIIIGLAYGIGVRGHKMMGVDFAGGDKLIMTFSQKIEQGQIRAALMRNGINDATPQYQKDISTGKESLQITSGYQTGEKAVQILKKEFPQANFVKLGLDNVGPTIGKEIQKTAIVASLLSLFGILVYVAFRYEFSFAVGAVVAVVHDVLMTIGCYCLSGREMNATFVAAVLTIIGFSINDTIVIFDRIREDLKLGVRGSFKELINQALNQTLSRTIITSGTVFIATISLFIFGGGAINDFAFTFLVGIITGTYSSIYIASALVLWWHRGERPRAAAPVMMEQEPNANRAAPVRA